MFLKLIAIFLIISTSAFAVKTTFIFKIGQTPYTFEDLKTYGKGLEFLMCTMPNSRVTYFFSDYIVNSKQIQSLKQLKRMKREKKKSYNDLKTFFKVLEYANKQFVKVRSSLLSSVEKLGKRRKCLLDNSSEELKNILRMEVFFESRFRLGSFKNIKKSEKSVLALIESIERQIVSKDMIF